MSALNVRPFNSIPYNSPGAAVVAVVPLALDTRSLAPEITDVRTIAVAKLNQYIWKLVAGDTWKFVRTYTGLQTGVTISKVYLTVKENPTDTDAAAMFQKSITTTASASGQITDSTTADGSIAFNVIAAKTDTILLTPEQDYYYDFQGIGSDGMVYTFETGLINPQQGVTSASS
jgi:hypothetical protein